MPDFWGKVDRRGPDDCWPWLASLMPNGYGHYFVGGSRSDNSRRWSLAHRFAYEELVGPIPAGLTLDHLCRNRKCVNPAHLEPVSRGENVRRGDNHERLKTHCKHGHEFTPDNTRLYRGERFCIQCQADRNARRRTA